MKLFNCRSLMVGGSMSLLLIPPFIFAETVNGFIPYAPRLSTLILAGSHTTLRPDLMIPTLGNENQILFLNAQAKSNTESAWYGALGTGYRQVYQDKRILGAYLYADRNASPENNFFWFISPGLESMGQVWDFRVNAYVPVSSQRELVSSNFTSDQGNYNYVTLSGHAQYDSIVNTYEEVGWGGDAEVGRTIPFITGLRGYIGAYHFNLDNANDINGIAGRLEFPINSHIALSFRDSYDNQEHNSAVVGVRLTMGGVNKSPRDPHQPIQERLLDPVERNMTTLTQGTAEPVVSEQETLGYLELQRSDIWFFANNADNVFVDETSCTVEHPCVGTEFTQSTIDQINTLDNHPSFYFKPGQYSSLSNDTQNSIANDHLYGRTEDYKAPQQSTVFVGGLNVNANTALDSIILVNDPIQPQTAALNLNSGSSLLLNNTKIGVDTNAQGQAFATGINMNDSHLRVTGNSEIHAFSEQGEADGILATGQNDIQVDNALIAVDSALIARGISIVSSGTSALNLTDTTVNVNASSNSNATVEADGIFMNTDSNNIVLQNNVINVQSNNTNGFGLAYGINMNANNGNSVDIFQGQMHVSSVGSTSSQVFGITASAAAGSNNVNINNTSININTHTAGNSAGAEAIVTNATDNTVNITDSSITALATGNYLSSVFGVMTNASHHNALNLANSTITANAASTHATGMANAIGVNSIAGSNDVQLGEANSFNVSAQAASYSAHQICINNICN